MTAIVFSGIFGIGFVFGFLLYYSVRHTAQFSIELLSSAIGAVGSSAVIGLVGGTEHWIGPYGLGILAGFLFYLLLALILMASGGLDEATQKNVLALRKKVLGFNPD